MALLYSAGLLLSLCVLWANAIDFCKVLHTPESECRSSCLIGETPHSGDNACAAGEDCCEPSGDPGAGGGPEDPTTIPVNEGTCGVVASLKRKRSVGYADIPRCTWPWLVSVRASSTGGLFNFTNEHFLNGILISSQYILVSTERYAGLNAAFDSAQALAATSGIAEQSVEAVLGEHYLNMEDDEDMVVPIDIGSANEVISGEQGLTILKMETAVQGQSCVRPVCRGDTSVTPNTGCYLAGWGNTDNGLGTPALSPVPLETNVTILEQTECNAILEYALGYATLPTNIICLELPEGRIATEEELGSPIMCPDSKGQWYLRGVLTRANYDANAEDNSFAVPLALDFPPVAGVIDAAVQ